MQSDRASIHWFTPIMSVPPWYEPGQSQGPITLSNLPCEWQELQSWSHHLLSPRCIDKNWDAASQAPIMGYRHPRGSFIHCATIPPYLPSCPSFPVIPCGFFSLGMCAALPCTIPVCQHFLCLHTVSYHTPHNCKYE